MDKDESSGPLLGEYTDDVPQWRERAQNGSKWRKPVFVTVFALSILANVYFILGHVSFDRKIIFNARAPNARSPYSGLPYDTQVRYKHTTEYSGENETLADALWDSISIDHLIIAVTHEWAEEKGLPESWPFPWDENKSIYFITAFHQLHCLKSMRMAIHDLVDKGETIIPTEHLDHCLDILRQDVMCRADDTPMPSVSLYNGAGENQVMQCKDFSKLVDWIEAPEQQACYRHLTNHQNLTHTIERYAFCPEDSEYYPVMEEYFEINGHHNPFE